jgi:hypothetical protein
MCFASRDTCGVNVFRPVGNAQVRKDGAVFLCQAGHVEHRYAFAVQMGGHAEQRAEGDHAGAADAGDQDVERAPGVGQQRLGQGRKEGLVGGDGAATAQAARLRR